MVSCRRPLSLSLSSSLLVSSYLSVVSSLSFPRARPLAHALGLIHIRAFEDTIHTPTCWNGVLPSPSLSLSLSSFLLVSSYLSLVSSLSLSRARPLALALGLIHIRALEDTGSKALRSKHCDQSIVIKAL